MLLLGCWLKDGRKDNALIIGMAVVTYLPRMIPMVMAVRKEFPEIVKEWLKYIPVSIFSSLVFPEVFKGKTGLELSINNPQVIASLICFFTVYKTRSLGATVIVGIISFMRLKMIL